LVLGTAQHLLACLTLALCFSISPFGSYAFLAQVLSIMGVLSPLRLEAHHGVNATPPSVGCTHASVSDAESYAMCIIAAQRVHAEREGARGWAVKDLEGGLEGLGGKTELEELRVILGLLAFQLRVILCLLA
jgi:hypothetical protein